jgi:imidazolonepropionase-like amidohydrolase
MAAAQLQAACSTAHSVGLRSVVHAVSDASVQAAIAAGCSQIEHGTLAVPATLTSMSREKITFDPTVYLSVHNYVAHKNSFKLWSGFDESTFATLEHSLAPGLQTFRSALAVPNLVIVFGSDAIAGAHGQNAEELIYRVTKGSQANDAAIRSATSNAAMSLGLGNEIGTIAVGFDADIIGVDGDPRTDITALRRVKFVMRAGRVYKYVPSKRQPPTTTQ